MNSRRASELPPGSARLLAAASEVAGSTFFYPCCGTDWVEPLRVFAPFMRDLIFSDLMFPGWPTPEPLLSGSADYTLVDTASEGDVHGQLEWRPFKTRGYRHPAPSWVRERYRHSSGSSETSSRTSRKPSGQLELSGHEPESTASGRELVITRRRGFAQIALAEIPERSIGIFMHRSDSSGEGGSGVYFLTNGSKRHPPLARLFDKLYSRLTSPALIVSDGSNCLFPEILEAHDRVQRAEATGRIARDAESQFRTQGLEWRLVGDLRPRGRRASALVWRVNKLE